MGFEKWKPSTELERLRTEFDELIEHLGSDHRKLKVGRATSDRSLVESSIDGASSSCASICQDSISRASTCRS